jgi:hypothetical protein
MCVSAVKGVSGPKTNPGQRYDDLPNLHVTKWDRIAVCNFSATQAFQVLPTVGNCSPNTVQSFHPGGMNICLADASARFASGNLTVRTWSVICDPRDGSPNQGGDW